MRTGTPDIGFFCLHNVSCEVGSCCLVVFGSFFPADSPDVFFAYDDNGFSSAELPFMFASEELFYCPAQVFGAVLCESVFDEFVNYCADCFAEAYGLQFAFFCVPGGVFREFFFWFLRLFSVFKCEKVNSDLFGYGFSVEVGAGFCGSDFDEAVSYPEGASFHAEFDDFVGDHVCCYSAVVSAVPFFEDDGTVRVYPPGEVCAYLCGKLRGLSLKLETRIVPVCVLVFVLIVWLVWGVIKGCRGTFSGF